MRLNRPAHIFRVDHPWRPRNDFVLFIMFTAASYSDGQARRVNVVFIISERCDSPELVFVLFPSEAGEIWSTRGRFASENNASTEYLGL